MTTTREAPRFSLVIPAYNEARWLPPLLDTVDRARAACSRGPDAVEVIVGDNASTDRTAEIAASRGCRVAHVETRTIAAARNGGARLARGGILLFVDADSLVHPGTFDAVDTALATGRFVGGATGVTSERWSAGICVTWAMMLPMVWLTGMDTGVVFCRREDFVAVGGYDERRRLAEDVKFLLALRRLGRRSGQRLTRLRGVKAVTSTRKFDEHGDWHYFTSMLALPIHYLLHPRSAARRIERYWYRARSLRTLPSHNRVQRDALSPGLRRRTIHVEESRAVRSRLKRKLDYSDLKVTPDDGKRYELVRGELLVTLTHPDWDGLAIDLAALWS